MTWVSIGSRKFLVDFDADGKPVRIKERKVWHAGHPYLEHIYNAPYWHARHHKKGRGSSIVNQILDEANRLRSQNA